VFFVVRSRQPDRPEAGLPENQGSRGASTISRGTFKLFSSFLKTLKSFPFFSSV